MLLTRNHKAFALKLKRPNLPTVDASYLVLAIGGYLAILGGLLIGLILVFKGA